jgi:hypothetical protein
MMTIVQTLSLTDRIDTNAYERALELLSSPSFLKAPLSMLTLLLMLRKRSQPIIAATNSHGPPPSTSLCSLTPPTRSSIHPEPSMAHSNSLRPDEVPFGPHDDGIRCQNASFPPYRTTRPQCRQNDTPRGRYSNIPVKWSLQTKVLHYVTKLNE